MEKDFPDGALILDNVTETDLATRHLVALGGVFNEAVTGMAFLDIEGRFQVVNAALCRMVGRTERDLVGIHPSEITHPEDRALSSTTVDMLAAGEMGTHQARKRYIRPDGSEVVVLRTTTVLRDADGRTTGMFSQMVDVTDLTEAQDSVRRSERRFRALVAHASELTVLVDRDARIVYTSPASLRLLGHTPASLEGRSSLELIHPEDLDRAREAFAAHVASSKSTSTNTYRVMHVDGSWRYAEVVATNLFDDPDVGAVVLNVRDVTERHDYEAQLAASEQRLRALVSNSWDVITLHAADGRYIYCSPAVTPMLGYTPDELIGSDPFALIHPEDVVASTFFGQVVEGSESPFAVQYRIRHRNGTWRWLESSAHNRLDDPAVAGIVVTTRDVTVRRVRAAQHDALATLSSHALRGESVESLFRKTVRVVAGVLGAEECAVLSCSSGRMEEVARHQRAGGAPLERASGAAGDGGHHARALTALIADDSRRYGALSVYWTAIDGVDAAETSFLESVANVLASALGRRTVEAELRLRALHDDLTGLPNRMLLRDRLQAALRRLDRHPGSVAVLFVDTDDFKLVNDSLGHAAGDTVVTAVAERVMSVTRRSDTVARFGGDEFVVMCEDTDAETAGEVAERLRDALAAPIEVAGRPVVITASIGISVASDPWISAEDLLAQADTAMYAAKQAGKDRSALFDLNMRRQVTDRLEAASGLRRALASDELRLFYQPLVRASSGDVVGSEALIRWEHPVEGLLGPDRFMQYAESSGVILPIGAWVIGEACRQAAAWNGQERPHLISINVSARQLAEGDLVSEVATALDATGLEARLVSLEVTESAVMSDIDRAARVLHELRDLGVKVGMDDFGTGHSSLSHLASLPFDFVKIDRSFIASFHHDRRAAALLETIATLCRSLDLAAVAEGVEDEDQLRRVRDLGIPYVQGFLFGRPVSPDRFGLG